MNEFEKAFVELLHRINNDPIKVFDDALTYVLCRFSTGAEIVTDEKLNPFYLR